jgi:hypothetical protein
VFSSCKLRAGKLHAEVTFGRFTGLRGCHWQGLDAPTMMVKRRQTHGSKQSQRHTTAACTTGYQHTKTPAVRNSITRCVQQL